MLTRCQRLLSCLLALALVVVGCKREAERPMPVVAFDFDASVSRVVVGWAKFGHAFALAGYSQEEMLRELTNRVPDIVSH